MTSVRTGGFSIAVKGAATYVETGRKGVAAWRFEAADGRWFELAESIASPEMFEAIGDGVSLPLSGRYRGLAAAQRNDPFATLNDELDFCAS